MPNKIPQGIKVNFGLQCAGRFHLGRQGTEQEYEAGRHISPTIRSRETCMLAIALLLHSYVQDLSLWS